MVFIREMTSAPPYSAAFAISVISVTLGVNFIDMGCFAIFLISLVMYSTILGSCPKAIPPCSTFGQEILISNIATSCSDRRSTTCRYSSTVFPHTLTIIFVSNCFKKGISRSKKHQSLDFASQLHLSFRCLFP